MTYIKQALIYFSPFWDLRVGSTRCQKVGTNKTWIGGKDVTGTTWKQRLYGQL